MRTKLPFFVEHFISSPFFVQESEITDKAIRSELLSMERLLVHTIYVRTKSRLIDLKTELQTILKDVECKYFAFIFLPQSLSLISNLKPSAQKPGHVFLVEANLPYLAFE